ncbi:putative leucine-rich repeat-containing protein DDB_G0290503 isoform X6 [Drosophila ananassae]|uniref:putative leucine-rich repeat-containing protein DDB_G0290503 isoform X6 n=1 Tax=Drosophila ananassae TaxID=7217 RepID=UPI0013A5DA78|nr:putative leucine-rich repeat-containing protein DDB_G0290503 isoform X6 [Drosophila ananassae]
MTTASLPRVPEGLRDLMKVYTKEVLREKPSDLYEFSAKFFNMIVGEKSHQAVRKYEPAQTYETIMKNRIRQQVPISMVFNIIPENLTDLIKQFIKAVLREKPENIYIFAQEYFQRLSKEKSGRTEYTKYATYEKSLKDKENVALVAKVTCECGRVLSAKTQNVENNTVLIEKEEKIDSNIPKKDDEEKNLISITYIKSVVIIQRNFRRYLKRVKTGPNKKDKCSSMEYMTSILLLQRQFRRLIAKKRVEKLKLSRTNQPKAKIDTANYMNAVLIIQRHYRIYLKKKQEQNRLKNEKVSLATAAIIIQRAFRRMLAVHKARRITSASADHPEDLNDNASETGSYTSVSTALLSTESTELGGTNYEERVHQKIIHEDEEVENSNVDGGLGKEYFEEPIKGAEKSILLRKSDTLSGPLIENPEDHESNDYSEFEVEKAKEELEDEFRAIKKRDAQNPSELELKLEKQDELQTQNLDAKETEKALDSKKENDTHLESEIEANLKSQKSIENLETENEDETRNIETIKGLEPIIKSEIEPKNTSEEPAETKNDTLQESESQNGKKEEEEKERSNKIFVDTPEDLEKKDNIEIIETIPPPKLVKAESQLQATPTISIEHVDDSPEENPQIQSESNVDIVPESSEPSIISAVDQPESLSEIEVENLKSIQDTDKEGRDQESRKQSSIDNEKEKPVKSLVSNTSQEEKNKEYRKQTSIDKDKHNPVESLLSNANQEGHVQESTKQSSIDNDKEKLVESLDSNERQEGHKQESPKQPSLDNEKEKPLESSILNPIQGVASNEDNSSRDENDIETGLIHRAKRSLEELESNLDKIKENSESIAEENNVENLVEKEGNLKNSIERIDQNKSQEKNSDAPECKKEMETQDSPEMVANIGEDSLEKEIKPLTLEDVVGEVERLGDEIKNDTAETISNIKNAVSESIDAVEVSKENLLNKQYNEKLFEFQNNKKESTTDPKDENVDQEEPLSRSKRSTDKSNEQSNEELNEFQNNDIESRTDPKDEKVDQEGPLLRSKRSTEESNEQSNEEINKIQHNEKETTTDPKDEKVDQEGPLIRSKRSTEETEINLDSETDNSKNLTGEIPKESLTEGGEKKLMEETTMLHHTKLPLAEESFHEKNTTKDSLVNESVISTEAESCEPGQKNVLTKSLEIDPCKESGDDLEASKDNEKQTLVKEHASTDGTKLFVPSVESPSEKELPTSVDKLVESITYDELKSANDISLKDNKTGTKELLEKKNIDACKMKRQEISIQVDNGNSIQIDPTDATDTIKNAKESNSASMEKHSANETTDSFNNAKEEKEFHSADKESDKEVVAIEKIPSEDSKTSPAETTDKNAVSKESNSEKNSGDSSSALENKPNDAELDNAVTVNKDDETILKSSSKESIDKTPTESDLEKDQGKELSDENDLLIKTEEVKNLEKELSYENDLLIKTEEVKNLDEVEIKETQAPDSDSPVSKEIDVPDSKAEKPIDSIPSKTEVNFGPEDAEVKAETGSDEDAILLTQSNLDKIEQDILSTQELVNNFLEKEIEFSSAQGPYESENLKEVVEEPCIKKSASLVNLSEEETGDPTDSSLSETTGLDTLSADTIDKATVKLAKPEEVIEKMSQLRESKSQSSQERIQSGDASFEEPIVRPMSSLQEQTSMDIEDGDIIVYNRLQRDETRESSAQSDSVVFGDPETEKIPEKDEESGRVHLMRHYTIAGDDPRGLFRSVTIDDALNYEEDMDSGHGIQNAASFYLDDETSENIRKKMMAYSLSETDSDYIDPRKVSQEDFDIDTAMADAMGTSTETESTIVSAATKIQAGARGFLTRRRLRRASAGTKSSTQDTKASFGNDAISESLERFIEEEAAKKIQAAYRIHTRKRKGYPRKMEGISLESNLAARRQKLQRGDALRNDSTPDDEHSVATNGGQTQKAAKPPRHKLVGDAKSRAAMELKWLTMRQNSMPVQIDCEVFRVIPKHMRKRIKSADANKRK